MEMHNINEMKIGQYYSIEKGSIGRLEIKYHLDPIEYRDTEVQYGCLFILLTPREGIIDELILIDSWYKEYKWIDVERLKIIPEIYIKKNIPKDLINIIYSFIF